MHEQGVHGATNNSRADGAEVDRNKCVLRLRDMQRAGVPVKKGPALFSLDKQYPASLVMGTSKKIQ